MAVDTPTTAVLVAATGKLKPCTAAEATARDSGHANGIGDGSSSCESANRIQQTERLDL